MNMQNIYKRLNNRATITNIISLVFSVLIWFLFIGVIILMIALVRLGNAGSSLASEGLEYFLGAFGSVISGLLFVASLAAFVLLIIPAIFYPLTTYLGFRASRKEAIAMSNPRLFKGFHDFKVDAIWKLSVNGVVLSFALLGEASQWRAEIKKLREFNGFAYDKVFAELAADTVKTLIVVSPIVLIVILMIMTLVDISKWRKFVQAARSANVRYDDVTAADVTFGDQATVEFTEETDSEETEE